MAILGIKTSCDDTSAAVVSDGPKGAGKLMSNVPATKLSQSEYGGVVPELASRAHMRRIVSIAEEALARADVAKAQLNAVAAIFPNAEELH